ncbi:MAG: nicotinate-nucleotide--dimethylbenzimidazole phosphoribosyltransferase [Candidatus Omnitrophota bacterium]
MTKIKETAARIKLIDRELMKITQGRLDNLTKPQGSLGRLEELARIVAGITGKEMPRLDNKVIFTLAADHGVTAEKVSLFPKEVTAQMVHNFLTGGAGINVLARHAGIKVVVVDMGVATKIPSKRKPARGLKSKQSEAMVFIDKKIALGTRNMSKGPAMSREEAVKSIETGIEVFEVEYKNGIDIIGTGDMGIGNTTAASAVTAAITGMPVKNVTGRGTGLDDSALLNKIEIIKESLRINKPDPKDALDVLSKVGGFEIGGLAGTIIAAASRRVPVVIDGFISGSAALLAYQIEPKVKEYMIAAHCSVEKGHKVIFEHIGLNPFLDLGMRLGEGTGAALGISIIEAAVKILTQMATFKDAGVSTKEE